MNTATGPKSTSFKVAATGVISGLGMIITQYVQNTGGAHSNVNSAVGGVLALGSILGKLIHDQGFNKASIIAGAGDIEKAAPGIKDAAAKVLGFVENDIPEVKNLVTAAESHIAAVEAKIPDAATIESTIRTVLSTVLTPPAA